MGTINVSTDTHASRHAPGGADPINMGLLQDGTVAGFINTTGSNTDVALKGRYVPQWKASTAYVAGQAVVNPSGDLVTAKVGFTSGSSYNAADWNLSASYAPPLPASPAAYNLPMQNSANTGLTWTTSQATVARALGWTIVTDPVYGAVADDATDNLAKFNAAVTATPAGGTVYVPPAASRYYLSGQLDLSAKPIQLVGGGWNCTVQPAYGSAGFTVAGIVGSVLRFGNTTGAGVYVGDGTNSGSVRDLAIIGPGSGSSRGLQVGNTAAKLRYRVERVLVGNWFQGFWTCMENSTIIGLYALGNDSGVTLTNASNGNTFVGLDVEVSTTYGVRIDGSTENKFAGGVFQAGSGTTVSIVNSSQGNKFDSIYFENLNATYGVNVAAGCDTNSWQDCHFGYGSTHDQVVIASNHCSILWPQAAPSITVSGAYNYFIGSLTGTNTDTGTSNVWIDSTPSGMGVRFGGRDVRINSGQKFYFETSGTGSYIGRDNATGDTVVSSGSNVVRTLANGVLRSGVNTSGARPSASGVGAGSRFYDTSLSKPIWSDGTVWRDAAGTAV